MKVLVTGGDGYIGRHLSSYLSSFHDVHILDNFSLGLTDYDYFYKDKPITLHECDILEYDKVKEAVTKINPQLAFHLAAIHYIPKCERLPVLAASINIMGTINLLRASKKGARIVFVSSAAVYAPSKIPHSEGISDLGPTDIYGLTKLHAEQYTKYYSRIKGLRTTIVRLFNVIGPGETNPHLLPVIISQLLKGNRKIKLGNLNPKRDYIYIMDVVKGLEAIGAISENKINEAEVLNLGTSQMHSVEEIVNLLSEVIREKIDIEIEQRRVRKTDRPFLCSDNTKLSELTGWKPRYQIRAALKETFVNPDFRFSDFEEII